MQVKMKMNETKRKENIHKEYFFNGISIHSFQM